MTPSTSLTKALAALKPGDTYILPDGDIIGNIVLPRGLSGSKGEILTVNNSSTG